MLVIIRTTHSPSFFETSLSYLVLLRSPNSPQGAADIIVALSRNSAHVPFIFGI